MIAGVDHNINIAGVANAKTIKIPTFINWKNMKEEKNAKKRKKKSRNIKSCPTTTLADLLTKPLTKVNIRKIHTMIKIIIGQQECVGASTSGTG
jgi:hypothetical protein